ncbi:MAG: plastocyanin/azurin family copper-binding protein [bacterium]|nr:plastocyanin/azurin family copper-binding protein [bacterium]
MKRLFLIGVLTAAICLAGLFVFFNYFQSGLPEKEEGIFTEEVPAGYFDLRGITEVLVDMKDFDFNPRRIVVSPGTKVLWKNGDELFHSVNFDSQPAGLLTKLANSTQLKYGELFTHLFNFPGTYTYHSSDNPATMTGEIRVK